MKTAFVSAAALVAAAVYSSAADCDLTKIKGLLYPNATQGLANCESATGINIFGVVEFPTLDQVKKLSQNVDCADYLNQINQVANAEIQCNVTVAGVTIKFGTLIADFLTGKTGNETDVGTDVGTDSGSYESMSMSGSDSGSTDLDIEELTPKRPAPTDAPTREPSTSRVSASSAHALSFVAFCVTVTLALTLQ
ncbi:unnamed protein product [Peronospora belbahrii]|uniref:Elicitin n=1 Tax=Peronospora belbahrii TaxID=622444 RepID=A0AAU9KPK7_9STRA|nr:unnamed protein product [Peronospora belbahrii]CAH0515701.1 unnamed protein product [Peronospora belbahrii]